MTKRRVPECKINWCCPYRTDLCQESCSEDRCDGYGDDFTVIVLEESCYIKPAESKVVTRYAITAATKELIHAFDRGDDVADMTTKPLTLETARGRAGIPTRPVTAAHAVRESGRRRPAVNMARHLARQSPWRRYPH